MDDPALMTQRPGKLRGEEVAHEGTALYTHTLTHTDTHSHRHTQTHRHRSRQTGYSQVSIRVQYTCAVYTFVVAGGKSTLTTSALSAISGQTLASFKPLRSCFTCMRVLPSTWYKATENDQSVLHDIHHHNPCH